MTIDIQPDNRIAAFGKNLIKVSHDSPGVVRYLLKVRDTSENVLATQYVTAFEGTGTFVLKGILSSLFPNSYIPFANVGIDSFIALTVAGNHSLNVNFDIAPLNRLGEPVENSTQLTGFTLYRAVDVNFPQWETSGFFIPFINTNCIRVVRSGGLILFPYYSEETGTVSLNLNGVNRASTITERGYTCFAYRDGSPQEVNVVKMSGGDEELIYVIDNKDYERAKTLYFMNRYGGWEWFDFIDYERIVKADKAQYTRYENEEGDLGIHQQINHSFNEYKLWGREVSPDHIEYLGDIVNSPIVFDDTGKRVRVLDDNILTNAGGILQPELTISYLEEKVINF